MWEIDEIGKGVRVSVERQTYLKLRKSLLPLFTPFPPLIWQEAISTNATRLSGYYPQSECLGSIVKSLQLVLTYF